MNLYEYYGEAVTELCARAIIGYDQTGRYFESFGSITTASEWAIIPVDRDIRDSSEVALFAKLEVRESV